MLKIFGIFASSDGAFYITDPPEKRIRFQWSVFKALYEIRIQFDSEREEK